MTAISLSPSSSIPGTYWQWRGNSIYYVKAGKPQPDKPALLLVHGFGASTDHWRQNIAQLQEEFQVWAIDLLGFGRSAKPNQEYSGNLWQEQLHDFITEVIGRSTVLAGNSLGGYASLCVAAAYPESTAGLILLNSAGPFSDTTSPSNQKPKSNRMGNLIRSILLQPWASFLLFQYVRRKSVIRKTLKKVYFNQSAVTDILVEDIYRPSCDEGAAEVFNAVFKTPQGEKVDILLSQIKCPLLLLWGEKDPWMDTKKRGNDFRRYYPQLTEYYLEAGHCPHDEIPDEVNNLITNWVLSQGRLQS
ncbi:alpha/beta fold hydrolase [Waterburya agarophytonicola K14]|uniref:Alpha/beta fold hydrolase n=1 Tax=Waterburya agarophytonicola KI4 TaxID=2874699 RepID=A0A964BSK8_9CYAN|nr:alpha/beta fold hydrolase [Waterburya agarophytonicola]MCC0177981.1 alpha/beta fold hydrolase [Waterburya agarophytonicola KI4]